MSRKKFIVPSCSLFKVDCEKPKPIFVYYFPKLFNYIFQTDSLRKNFSQNYSKIEAFRCNEK